MEAQVYQVSGEPPSFWNRRNLVYADLLRCGSQPSSVLIERLQKPLSDFIKEAPEEHNCLVWLIQDWPSVLTHVLRESGRADQVPQTVPDPERSESLMGRWFQPRQWQQGHLKHSQHNQICFNCCHIIYACRAQPSSPVKNNRQKKKRKTEHGK